jgi:hypothetical protein
VAQRYFYKTGNAVEIGVWRGAFSEIALRVWLGKYYMVDTWAWRPFDNSRDKNYMDSATNIYNLLLATNRTAFAKNRTILLKMYSQEAARRFDDGFFDWIFIDAKHTKTDVTADLNAWYPKLRQGGLLTGDDYGDASNTPIMTERRYRLRILGLRNAKLLPSEGRYRGVIDTHLKWGVISAVQSFAQIHNLTLHVTWLNDCYTWPSWYMVK